MAVALVVRAERVAGVAALLDARRTVGDQVAVALAVVAPLWLRPHRTLGGDVVRELATVVAPANTRTHVPNLVKCSTQ
jgi:hypothetical protein